MEKMNFTNNQTTFAYALYMIASSYFNKAICKSGLLEKSMLVQYKEQKLNTQYFMEETCIRYMEKISSKLPKDFFNQEVEVHIVKKTSGSDIVFAGGNDEFIIFHATYTANNPKIRCLFLTKEKKSEKESFKMSIDSFSEGMYCSKEFAQWMIRKNEQNTDAIPAKTYHKLVRMYCKANYYELLTEEERKGNDFYYTITQEGDSLRLNRSYDLVFLPYEARISECPLEKLAPVEEFVPGYRILQTRGYMPGTTKSAFEDFDFSSMQSMISYITNNMKNLLLEDGTYRKEDVFTAREFQMAEQKGFIDNSFPYSFGPECPDKIICYQMFTRVFKCLANELYKLNVIETKAPELQELGLFAGVCAIFESLVSKEHSITNTFSANEINKNANHLVEKFCINNKETDFAELCRTINKWRNININIIIDRTAVLKGDYDFDDTEEAPIGLTAGDREKYDYN